MKIIITKKFNRDIKKLAKKHYPINILKPCLHIIIKHQTSLLIRIKDHALHGKWQGYREFHPARYGSYENYDDWIVIYKIQNYQLTLTLVATGKHSLLSQ